MKCPRCQLEVKEGELRCPRCRESLVQCGGCSGNCFHCITEKSNKTSKILPNKE